MHEHRIAWPAHLAAPATPAFSDQRALLLELVVDPPGRPEPVAALARRLDRPPRAIAHAAGALARSGLVVRSPRGLRASDAALAFEALWPTRL